MFRVYKDSEYKPLSIRRHPAVEGEAVEGEDLL